MNRLCRWICLVVTAVIATVVVIAQPQSLKGPVAGAAQCAACHKKIYDRWSESIHGKMIQRATQSTVVARPEVPGGPSRRRLWRNGSLFIEEDGVENRVDLTLGNRRIQHYLTYKPNGQVIVLHSTWDVKRQQWFDSAEIVPNAPPHFVQQWNMTCFYCHVTQQRQDVKGFDAKTLTYRTSWVESSASCERCHGPMSEHASGNQVVNSFRKELASADRYDKLMVCGQCHWAKIVVATGYNTRKSYFDYYSPGLIHMDVTEPSAPSWWADGRPRRFSLEAAGFFLSGCFQSGKAFCTSCHDPHWNRTDGNEELMKRPDQYCKNCHTGFDAESHTKHATGSAGSSCVGCHMPYAVSGVKSRMRDHSFLPPEPENTIAYDIPNACNECHTDETSHWAAEYVNQWYPKRSERPRLRAKTFSLAAQRSPDAIEYLLRLAEDRTENPLIRSSSVGYFSQYRSDRLNRTLIKLSTDNDPMVRLESARALAGINNIEAVRALGHALSDVFRTIRIQAAASLVDDSFIEEPPQLDKANPQFAAALQEYRESLEVDADNPTMQVRRGSLELFLAELATAREAYELALKLDPRQADAFVGLALVEAKAGNLEEALKYAKNATKVSDDEKYGRFVERIKLMKH